jgi:sugar lactone lactonase YvrE
MKPNLKHLQPFLLAGCLLLSANPAFSQQKDVSLEKQWETDTAILRVPESVYFDAGRNVLYISNIDGAANGKDGKGSISRLTPEGKVLDREWVKGLNAPKGMGIYKNRLYVADLTELLVIDIASGRIEQRVPVEGSVFLNDIAIDNKGIIYVSDTRVGKVHQYKNGKVSTLLEGVKDPNGLLFVKGSLYVGADGSLFRLEKDNTLRKLAAVGNKVDGIEQVKDGEFIVSCWPGEVFYVNAATGSAVKLLDTQQERKNTADIGYSPQKKIVYIPTFNGNTVAAYLLKGL